MTSNFVVGVDGSERSMRAALFAAERAKQMDTRLLVVFVIEWSPYTFNTQEENAQRKKRFEGEIESATHKILNPMLKEIRELGVDVEGFVRHGNISKVIIQLAKEHDAKALFIGRLGTSRLKSMLFGSVTSNLVQMSPIPVVVVP